MLLTKSTLAVQREGTHRSRVSKACHLHQTAQVVCPQTSNRRKGNKNKIKQNLKMYAETQLENKT